MEFTSGAGHPPNVVIVVLDCVRAKSLAFGRDGGARTPALAALARRGWSTSEAIAPSNWTLPSHLAMVTGQYPGPAERGAPSPTERRPAQTVAERLGRRGYECALFSEQALLVDHEAFRSGYRIQHAPRRASPRLPQPGVGSGGWVLSRILRGRSGPLPRLLSRFPELTAPFGLLRAEAQEQHKRAVSGGEVVSSFDRWLRGRDDRRPFHAFVNLVDAHEPYDLTPELGAFALRRWSRVLAPICLQQALPELRQSMPWSLLESGYLRSIESADRKLGELLASVERAGEGERTAVLVTSDHGQQFGEMGMVNHGCGATDAVARVPLVTNVAPEVLGVGAGPVSLTRLPQWVDRIVSAHPPESRPTGPTISAEREAPRCYGAPASDLNPLLRGVGGSADRWNHRLVATYLTEGKLILDVRTSEVLWWPRDKDPDVDRPVTFGVPSATDLIADDVARVPMRVDELESTRELPYDETVVLRLAEWGYA